MTPSILTVILDADHGLKAKANTRPNDVDEHLTGAEAHDRHSAKDLHLILTLFTDLETGGQRPVADVQYEILRVHEQNLHQI